MYLLYEQYGLDLFYGIPEEFLRAFLPNLGFAWSKKGSLDVVEYIVSSLSGIKTSTEVTYDEFDNPIVTVMQLNPALHSTHKSISIKRHNKKE